MKLAVISDIHANLHALQAVLQDIEHQNPELIYCLGDLVGYGAFPNEVIALIREREIPTIMGNYDQGVGFDLDDCGCIYKDQLGKQMGQLSLMWSRKHTTAKNKAFLQSLPKQIRQQINNCEVLFVHGSPRKINEYLYEDRKESSFQRIASQANSDLLLFGHTHLPYVKIVQDTLMVNTGSVGKPRGADIRSTYAIIDLEGGPKVEIRRVSYDVTAAVNAIYSSELPNYFGDLLLNGGLE